MKKKNLFASAAFALAILGAFAFKTDEFGKQTINYFYKVSGIGCNAVSGCFTTMTSHACVAGTGITYFQSVGTQNDCFSPAPTLYRN